MSQEEVQMYYAPNAETLPTSSTTLTELDRDHFQNFNEFFEHLNLAARSAMPRVARRHSDVFVLLLRWEDDDLGTEVEIQDLETVFRDTYHYHTEQYLIPTDDSTTQLEYKLTDFRKAHDNGTNLLILYYGGHGFLERRKDRLSRSIWRAERVGGSSLVWSDLQGVLERSKSDVVFILDCCFAASAARSAGSKEGLWACNSEVTTTGVNDNSFTRNLIEELQSLSTSRFNVAMLHARLMRRYRKPGPHTLLTEPWYTYLGDEICPSTELAPQLVSRIIHSDACSTTMESGDSSQLSTSSSATSFTIDQTMTETLVLLAVRLKDTERIPGLLAWQNWCHNLAPEDIDTVHALGRVQLRDLVQLEGQFLSHSVLLLVSMPVFLWDRLPGSPAYSFVGFVKSRNRHFPTFNPQLEMHLKMKTDQEDWEGVNTIDSLSEVDDEHVIPGYEFADAKWKAALASRYHNEQRWKEAEELEVELVEISKRVLGAEHPSTLTSTANLASTCRNQGKLKEAEELEVQVVKMRKQLLGTEHPDTLTSVNNLALTYNIQGRWYEAKELFMEVMEISKRVLGAEHPSTLTSMANLASTYWNQGQWKKTEELEVQIMETRKRMLGAEHPDILSGMTNLASTYYNQGRLKEAEELEVQVMETRKRVLGQEHPDTLTSMANLASTYRSQGRWKEAEKLGVQVMETRKGVLGQEHPSTLTIMSNLASTYWNQGRLKKAEELGVQVMETRKKVLGREHPDTLTSMTNLASIYQNQGRLKEAEELGVQVMETRKKILGQEHPSTLTIMANLASTYQNQGRLKEAEELGVQVMETRKRVLEQEHPDTLTSMANLASTYGNQGRLKEAEELGVQVMETRKRVLGREHPDTLTSMTNLASTYQNQGRLKEAEELGVQVMETRKRVLGQEHPDTLTSMHNLSFTWKSQSRDIDAFRLMSECYLLRKQKLGPDHPHTISSLVAMKEWETASSEVDS
jgi:tetratricopeptide (TPR) repeat protein